MSFRASASVVSEPSSGAKDGGLDGRGSIIAASREGAARRGRLDRVCVVAKRRDVHIQ